MENSFKTLPPPAACPISVPDTEKAREINRLYRRVGNRGTEKTRQSYGKMSDSEIVEARALADACLNCVSYNRLKSKENPCPAPTNKRLKMISILKHLEKIDSLRG